MNQIHNQRFILNADRGKDNLVTFDEFYEVASKVLNKVIDLILPLSGPKALHNLVVYEHINVSLMSNVFSNDGIHNLKSLEFISPIENFIVNYIRYIAERVEKAAGDGTSTAIYLSAKLILSSLERVVSIRKKYKELNIDEVTTHKFIQNDIHIEKERLVDMLTHLMKSLDSLKINLNDPKLNRKIKRSLIGKLAATTSRDNEILTKYVVDLYTDIPPDLYEQTFYHRLSVETSDALSIEYPSYDLLLSTSVSTKVNFNANLHTEWHQDEVDLLPVACPIDSVVADIIIGFLNKRESDKPLLILANGIDDTALVRLERCIDGSKIVLARLLNLHPAFVNNPIEIRTILAMTGKETEPPIEIEDFEKSVIPNTSIQLTHRELKINNVFEHHPDSRVHPYFLKPSTSVHYDQLRYELERQIKNLNDGHNRKEVAFEVKEFTRIYRQMIGSRLPILIIGGSSVEHLQMVNIVEDTLGVVSVAMKHGIVLDAIPKLQIISEQYRNKEDLTPTNFSKKLFFDIETTLNDFWKLTYESRFFSIDDELNEILNNHNKKLSHLFIRLSNSPSNSSTSQLFKVWDVLNKSNVKNLSTVQSFKAIQETFKRLIETVPNLMISDKIIVPHAVMDREKETPDANIG